MVSRIGELAPDSDQERYAQSIVHLACFASTPRRGREMLVRHQMAAGLDMEGGSSVGRHDASDSIKRWNGWSKEQNHGTKSLEKSECGVQDRRASSTASHVFYSQSRGCLSRLCRKSYPSVQLARRKSLVELGEDASTACTCCGNVAAGIFTGSTILPEI